MPKTIQSIQFMRFVAALLVVFFHATQAIRNNLGGISAEFLHFTELGASGVHIFFVISGFIMMYTSFSSTHSEFLPKDFYIRRFLRIYPIYWVCCALYVLFHDFFGNGYNVSLGGVAGSLFLLPGYSHLIIGPGWTLAYEIYFYLCFGVLMCLGLSRGFFALFTFFALSILIGILFNVHNAFLKFLSNSLLIEFLCGSAIAYIVILSERDIVPKNLSFIMQITAICALISTYFVGYRSIPTFITWGVPSAVLIAGLVFNERQGFIWGFVQRFAFLGNSSYSLYLLHILLIDLVITIYKTILPPPGVLSIPLCIIATIASVAVAVVFYNLIEYNLTIVFPKLMQYWIGSNRKGVPRSAKI